MAHADPFESAALTIVAGQIGRRLATFRPESMSVTVHETFQLWLLPPGSLATPQPPDLLQIAVRSKRWHHQLHDNNSVFGFARSNQEPNGQWMLHELFDTPIAAEIDEAISVVDQPMVFGDPLIRLVFAPAYQLYALWLIDAPVANTSRAVVASVPSQFSLPRFQVVPSQMLLQSLSIQEPIAGVST
jgi:hypothetical protein